MGAASVLVKVAKDKQLSKDGGPIQSISILRSEAMLTFGAWPLRPWDGARSNP